jgi:hypothetical protein
MGCSNVAESEQNQLNRNHHRQRQHLNSFLVQRLETRKLTSPWLFQVLASELVGTGSDDWRQHSGGHNANHAQQNEGLGETCEEVHGFLVACQKAGSFELVVLPHDSELAHPEIEG